MSWLVGAAVWLVAFLVLEVLAQGIGEMVAPVFSPLRLLYRPPHGRLVLGATWLLALGLTVIGFRSLETRLGAITFVASIPAALFASIVYRNEIREEARDRFLPPRNVRP